MLAPKIRHSRPQDPSFPPPGSVIPAPERESKPNAVRSAGGGVIR